MRVRKSGSDPGSDPDFLVSENVRLLIFGPLLAGLAALGVAFPVGMGPA